MSETENNPTVETVEKVVSVDDTNVRRDELRAKADLLGVKYSPNIGLDKLEERIVAKQAESEPKATAATVTTETITSEKQNIKNALIKLKVRITNLDPNERDHTTLYKAVLNKDISVAKVVPLDKIWYVPACIVAAIDEAMVQVHVHEIDPKSNKRTGNMIPKQVKKYNVQYLT